MSSSTTTANAPPPVGHYPHARRAGGLLFLSGIGPRSPDGGPIPEGIEAQCRAVFANVRSVLEASGSAWERLVDVTVFLTDIPGDFAVFNRLWAEHFPQDPPCRTTVEVTRLPTPIAVELKCIATVED
jgi:2-aminomuconate deaminase